jgi:hypothetical protein
VNTCCLPLWSLCLALGLAWASGSQAVSKPVRSASGQFSVLPAESTAWRGSSAFLAESDLLHLTPTLLTISAERLRQHLTRELQDTSAWQGKVRFELHATDSFEAPMRAMAEWQGRLWQYRVSLPEYISEDRFVSGLVEVNLLEMANRTSAGRSAEIPFWLTEGLTAHLLASRSLELILPPPKLEVRGMSITPWVVEEVNYQPLARAHARLRTNTPLTLEQLSWPGEEASRGRRGEVYRHCAQLFVHELLQLPRGRPLMNAFIRNLAQHYNWQVAFLETYHDHFSSLLDLEKWWALQVAHFTGRELDVTYSYGDSLVRLNQVLRFPVEVRLATNDLPLRGAVSLQVVIQEWDGNRQVEALEQMLSDLALLRTRIAPELVPLLDDYRLTIESFLRNRNRTGLYLPKGTNRQASLIQLIWRTTKSLDELDAELAGRMPEAGEGPSLSADRPG